MRCFLQGCPEPVNGALPQFIAGRKAALCKEHLEAWRRSGECNRAVTALVDWKDRIEAEERNGCPPTKCQ